MAACSRDRTLCDRIRRFSSRAPRKLTTLARKNEACLCKNDMVGETTGAGRITEPHSNLSLGRETTICDSFRSAHQGRVRDLGSSTTGPIPFVHVTVSCSRAPTDRPYRRASIRAGQPCDWGGEVFVVFGNTECLTAGRTPPSLHIRSSMISLIFGRFRPQSARSSRYLDRTRTQPVPWTALHHEVVRLALLRARYHSASIISS